MDCDKELTLTSEDPWAALGGDPEVEFISYALGRVGSQYLDIYHFIVA